MYRDIADEDLPQEREAALLQHAGDLVMRGGLGSLTLRSLAREAGVSPSLVTYRFGSRELLVRRMFEASQERDALFWQRMEEGMTGMVMSRAGLAGLLSGLVMTALTSGARDQTLRWICASEATRVPALQGLSRRWSRHGVAFWRSVLEEAGCDEAIAPGLSACTVWIIRVGLTAQGEALLTRTWMMDLAHRLSARLFAHAPVTEGDSAARQQIETLAQLGRVAPEEIAKQTPQRIIEAAAELAGRHGPDALTHRLIAKEAGVSLSSMTHHFASLGEIQQYAFSKLYEEAKRATLPDLPESLSIEAFTRRVMPAIFQRAESQGRGGVAMDEIILAASRASQTEVLGSGLMALVGQSSTIMLKTMAGGKPVDRLDGQLCRFAMIGLNEQAALQPEEVRQTWFSDACARFLRCYLGKD